MIQPSCAVIAINQQQIRIFGHFFFIPLKLVTNIDNRSNITQNKSYRSNVILKIIFLRVWKKIPYIAQILEKIMKICKTYKISTVKS